MLPISNAENMLEEDTLELEGSETEGQSVARDRGTEDESGPLQSGLTLEQAKKIFKKARRTQTVFSVLCKFNLEDEGLACLWSAEKDSEREDFDELSTFAEYNDDILEDSLSLESGKIQGLKLKTPQGDTLLMFAAYIGCLQLVKDILDRDGSIIDDKNATGYTALMLASLKGHDHVVQELLEQSADPNLKNNQGKTAAALAEEREGRAVAFNDKYDQVLSLLISEDCEYFTPTFNLLRRAFKTTDKKVIHRILEKNPKLLLQEIDETNSQDEENKVDAETKLLFEEFFESICDDYEHYSREDRSEIDAFVRYVLGIYLERIQDGSMSPDKQVAYYSIVEKYLEMKKTADIQDMKEQQEFFQLLENIKNDRVRLDDPTLVHEFRPYRNQFNSRLAYIKAMQKNTTFREMVLNYDQGIEDAREIIKCNKMVQSLEFRSHCSAGKEQMQKFLSFIDGHIIRNISLLFNLEDTLMPLLLANNSLKEIRYVACKRWNKENNEALLSNRNLKSISIGISFSGLSELFNALANQKSLETVTIKINSPYYIPSDLDFDALIHFIEHNRTVKSLNLDFALSRLKIYVEEKPFLEDLSRFFRALSRNTSLTSFLMNCSNYSSYSTLNYRVCRELGNILNMAKDALTENYTLISFGQEQSADHMNHSVGSNMRQHCKVKLIVTEMIGLLLRNNLLKPLLEVVRSAETAPEITDFDDPQDTRFKLVNQAYEVAMKIYQETHMEDIFLHLAKILATRFPGYPTYAYRALASTPEQLTEKRMEAQIILACKDGKGIPQEFANIRMQAKNLILQLQKMRVEQESESLSEPEEINSEDSFKEQMAHLFEAQKLSKVNALTIMLPNEFSNGGSLKTSDPADSLKHRIDHVANEYLGFKHQKIQNIQTDAPTITTILKEIRGYGDKIKEIRVKLGSAVKRPAEVAIEKLHQESSASSSSSSDGQNSSKKQKRG